MIRPVQDIAGSKRLSEKNTACYPTLAVTSRHSRNFFVLSLLEIRNDAGIEIRDLREQRGKRKGDMIARDVAARGTDGFIPSLLFSAKSF